MTSAQGIQRPERPKGAPLILLFTTSQASYNLPPWWRRAKITVQDGGYSSSTSTGSTSSGGNGGDAGFSLVDLPPGVPLQINAGTGGVGGGAGTNLPPAAGGLSSVSVIGRMLISAATAAVKIKGGAPAASVGSLGAPSFLSTPAGGAGNTYGGGAGGASVSAAANQGGQGCVIFEYMEA